MSASRHIPLAGLARRDVNDIIEEIRLPMLAPEILTHYVSRELSLPQPAKGRRACLTYSAYDIFMVREVRLAVLAAIDLVAVQVDVVREPHGRDSAQTAPTSWKSELRILV